MPENNLVFALISTILYLIWTVPYFIGIWKKEVLPHPFSFGTWLILVGVNLTILYQTHAGWSLMPALLQFVSLVFYTICGVFVFRKIQINWFDYLCLGLAIATIVAWYFVSSDVAATLTAIIDFIAFLPTMKKWWIQPHTEYVFPWLMSAAFPVFLMLSTSEYTFSNMAFYSYLIVVSTGFAGMIWLRQRVVVKLSVV